MDDVPGLDDKSKKFASLLTVACKFNYTSPSKKNAGILKQYSGGIPPEFQR